MHTSKKNIVFFHKSLVIGGAEIILVNYLKILANNHELDVELWLLEEQAENAYFDQIPNQIKVSFLLERTDIQQLTEDQQALLACKKIESLLMEKRRSFIVNFNSHFDFFLAKYSLNIPVIRWVHGIAHCHYWENNYDYFHFILNKHHCLITVNEELKDYCLQTLKRLRVKDLPIYRIYNPVDIDRILEMSNQEEIFLDNEYLLQVSRLDVSKNHLQLIDIYVRLKQLGIKEKLIIIGDGENYLSLKQRIEQLGLEQDCLLLGNKSNPYPFMKNAKLFLHTSLSEGLPTVLIESMVCGVPVVAMDCPTGPKEILNNGEYGELVKLKDEEEFVCKTYNLLNNDCALSNFKEKCKDAVSRFGFNCAERDVSFIFTKIINDSSPVKIEIIDDLYKKSLIRKGLLKINKWLNN